MFKNFHRLEKLAVLDHLIKPFIMVNDQISIGWPKVLILHNITYHYLDITSMELMRIDRGKVSITSILRSFSSNSSSHKNRHLNFQVIIVNDSGRIYKCISFEYGRRHQVVKVLISSYTITNPHHLPWLLCTEHFFFLTGNSIRLKIALWEIYKKCCYKADYQHKLLMSLFIPKHI